MREDEHSGIPFRAGFMGGMLIIMAAMTLLMLPLSCSPVSAGELGVKTQWGATTGEVLNPGLHFVWPIAGGVQRMSTQTHVFGVDGAESASHDLQVVHTTVAVNYHLDPESVEKIYTTLGPGFTYRDRIMRPSVFEVMKASTSRYPAGNLITDRPKVKENIETMLASRLLPYGIVVEGVNITNFDFSDEFNHSIEQKVIAEQLSDKARNDLERIKIEKDQQITQAQAQAESIRIRSEALAQNQRLVEWEAVQRWNGVLPIYTGSGAIPFININR
jgi:regulator of protease activity HflC (stomatin/prohibitin superfamily)